MPGRATCMPAPRWWRRSPACAVSSRTEEGLRELPGIGAYTAAAIAAIAFNRPATVLDGNIERVMARLFQVETPLPDAKPILRAHAETLTPSDRPGDYAQAVMDLGATICTPQQAALPALSVGARLQPGASPRRARAPAAEAGQA